MSFAILAILIIGGAVLASVVCTLVIRSLMHAQVAEGHNDVLVPLFLTAGVIYAVLLGFLVIAMLDSYEAAHKTTADEASLLVPLYRQSEVMAPEMGEQMRELLHKYAENVISGWSEFQKTGHGNPEARKGVDDIIKVFAELRPATKPRELIAAQFLETFSQLIQTRNTRILEASESLSWVMWAAAGGGGLILLGMSAMLFMDRVRPHLIMGGVLAAFIGTLLYIMVILNHPFLGPLAVSAEPFEADLALFTQIDSDFK
jgi:hypothetical protein